MWWPSYLDMTIEERVHHLRWQHHLVNAHWEDKEHTQDHRKTFRAHMHRDKIKRMGEVNVKV